jgi:hypothetical protein
VEFQPLFLAYLSSIFSQLQNHCLKTPKQQPFDHRVEQIANASAVLGGDRKHVVLTEAVKLACEIGERQSVNQ